MTAFPVAEKFKAPQGEGLHTGVPMAFIRLVGCSVGKKICTACDTDFEQVHKHLGGGVFTVEQLLEWVGNFEHICLTGGEPLDRDLRPLLTEARRSNVKVHIETSGTVEPAWIPVSAWITVSPKPGYLERMIRMANEVKVIHCGLGDGDGWPTVADAIRWASTGKIVYLQPRNEKFDINGAAMADAIQEVLRHPQLRLSAQLHKYVRTR